MKILPLAALALVLLGLAGCLPTSQNPLSSPDTATADTRLAGLWYGRSGDDSVFLHFVADKGPMMDIVEVDHQKDGGADTNIYTSFPSVIDGVHYLNVQEKKGTNKNYYLARYHIGSDGQLTIWLMSEKPVVKAVKAEKLAGDVDDKKGADGKPDPDVNITASTEKLAAFVKNGDPETLFAEKFATFKRVTLPAIEAAKPSPTPKAKATPTATPKAKKKKPASDQ